ncbi:hypothetical protein C4565_02445 [Candidatus Parcubacteria bacterium]|jgi:hypothetical protein|nr:MAG: hypothetical protein C4565_02445 [Candidatus Parcubacteria bacterium]
MSKNKKEKFFIQKNLQRQRFQDKLLLGSNNENLTLQDLVDFLNKKEIALSRVRLPIAFNIMVQKLPVTERTWIEIDGVKQRLSWVARNRPEVLLRIVCMTHACKSNREVTSSAIFSEFAKLGLRRKELRKIIEEHPEWMIDLGVFNQM